MELEKFLSLFNGNFEFNNLTQKLTKQIAINNKKENIYFVAGVKDNTIKRANDEDILEKNYFVIDVDIREYFNKKDNKIIDDTELKRCINQLVVLCETDGYFKEWSAFINSWNGCHIYYRADKSLNISKEDYSIWVKVIYELFDLLLKNNWYWITCDHSCSNISRITRLPESINFSRNKKYWLEPKKVEILALEKNNSQLIEKIKDFADQKKNEKIENSYLDKTKKENETIEKILSLPLSSIICEYLPVELASDLKNFTCKEKPWNQWMFLAKDEKWNDYLINIWTHFLKEKWLLKKSYNTFSFIKDINNYSNTETYKYFEDKYWIKKEKPKPKLSDFLKIDTELDNEKRYSWGTDKLNTKFWVIRGWNYIVIAGETGDGKTTFALNQALKNTEMGHNVLYFSLEMDTNELINNLARKYACFEIEEEFKKNIPETKKYAFEKKRLEILQNKKLKIAWMKKGSDLDILDIQEMIKNHNEKIDLLYLDNFDLLELNTKDDELTKQRKISKKIMNMASNLNIPIIVLHHYRKKSSQWKQTRTTDDLWWNRKISHDADYVLHLARTKWADLTAEEKSKTNLWLAKARGYDTSFWEVYFYKGHFYDYFPNF